MSVERKERWVQVRITREQDELIKKFGGVKADIWRIGLEKWLDELPEKLKEKADYHKKMSIQCIDKLTKCIDIINTKKSRLDECCLQYIKFGRDIPDDLTELSHHNKNWIESKIKNMKLNCDIDRFIERCKELKEDLNESV